MGKARRYNTRKQKKQNRKTNRKTSRKMRKSRGGGWGFTNSTASSLPSGTVNNPMITTDIGDCRAASPPGFINPPYTKWQVGLPGMNGGKRTRKGVSACSVSQQGGRYSFDLSPTAVGDIAPNGAAYWAGTYAPVQRIACEGSTPNPLNPGPHTPSTEPPAPHGPVQTGGVGGVDSPFYYAPTAGYDNKPSTWVDSVGAPVQLQVPYDARALNPACLYTGSPPPLTGALQQGGKRRKNRKVNRKVNRKTRRSNRK